MMKIDSDKSKTTILTDKGQTLYTMMKTNENYKKCYLKNSYQQFKSKKNTVAYVILHGKPRVIKWYISEYKENMINENSLLKLMDGSINVPKIIEMDLKNNVLIMNFIPGENLCDLINNNTNSIIEKEKLMVLLAEWYCKFHEF